MHWYVQCMYMYMYMYTCASILYYKYMYVHVYNYCTIYMYMYIYVGVCVVQILCGIIPIRYFTWDSGKFPSPAEMQNKLAHKGRKVKCRVSWVRVLPEVAHFS